MSTAFIYKNWNNYRNRTIKFGPPSDEEYLVHIERDLNFKPNDGINTTLVLGKFNNAYNGGGDYIILDDNSHWFILEQHRNREGQYVLQIRRDLLLDYYPQWTNATASIQKAIVTDSSPFIYNQEPITTNQIKKKEYQLKDQTGMAWICGFVARTLPSDGDNAIPRNMTLFSDVVPDITVTNLSDWTYAEYNGRNIYYKPQVSADMYVERVSDLGITEYTEGYKGLEGSPTYKTGITSDYRWVFDGDPYALSTFLSGSSGAAMRNAVSEYGRYFVNNPGNDGVYLSLLNLKNQIIYVTSTNTYYRIQLSAIQNLEERVPLLNNDSPFTGYPLYTFLNNHMREFSNRDPQSGNPIYYLNAKYQYFTFSLVPVSYGEYTLAYPDQKISNKNAPFDIFCIPYADDRNVRVGNTTVSTNKTFALSIASEIGRNLGSYCYDIQLLPFCPLGGYFMDGNVFDINSTDPKRFTEIKDDQNNTVAFMFWAAASSGTFNILTLDYEDGYGGIITDSVSNLTQLDNIKINNQCDLWRLVSPNYNGQFEFSVAKNGGLDFFNVDYTYLPYSSYIHVNPNFSGLYGSDFNDSRGLICQGDFSVMYLSDPWTQYQIQNKNYNAIFNREIENMDINRKYNRIDQMVNSAAGALGSGALMGGVLGVGAGVAAGLASATAGLADLKISDKLYHEQKSYAQDLHQYQLDNVRALPSSIAKTTAYTENNKIFPILEFYSCTEEEKIQVARIIQNEGMTVNVIDLPFNYIGNHWSYQGIQDRGFIQGEIIKITDIDDDSHLANEINEELRKGVYTFS